MAPPSSHPPIESSGRSQRKKRPTEKAQQALDEGQNIPGLTSSSSSPPRPPDSPLQQQHFQQLPALYAAPAFTTHTLHSRAEDAIRDMSRMSSVLGNIITAPVQAKDLRTQAASANAAADDATESKIPAFTDATLRIYDWPYPGPPKDFTKLTPSQQRFKEKANKTFLASQFPDEGLANDWNEFAGDADDYNGGENGRNYAIATAFVQHAKKAFIAGTSWEEYEHQEESIDSMAAAKKEPDPATRRMMMAEALDNDLRLAVFANLKKRLCEEIWEKRYVPPKPLDARALALQEEKKRAKAEEGERTVERWETRTGLNGEVYPVVIWKTDTSVDSELSF